MSEKTQVKETTTATQDNVAVVRAVYEAFGRGDIQAIFDYFHPDGVVYQSSRLPWGGLYHGHQGLGDFLGRLTEAIESQVTTERYIDDAAGHVAAVGSTRGRVRATGREFVVPETHIWTVKDGQVTRFESYIDTGLMRAALGI